MKMNVEEQNDMSFEQFPVGMRVFAVDDDPTCLKVLSNLLRKCQYQVTTSNKATMALEMLRENRDKFDLVISDVNMPDMDGFKLLELVGLEMDLPVIMLSAHSDTKLVMKGITHGACDYLLKPVRIEELKNIWQHVVRRRKLESKDRNTRGNLEDVVRKGEENGKGVMLEGDSDQNAKLNKKRKNKDDDDDEDYDCEDEASDSDDQGSQKRPRVVWSPDLHRKFVDAVGHLGYEKAFPKKILDLMNVEGLTRENIASHLQKFRQYLKKQSIAKTQQANNSLSVQGFEDLHALTVSSRLGNIGTNPLLPPVSHPGMLVRLNSPAGLTMRGLTSSGLAQPSNPPRLTNTYNHGKFQPFMPAGQTSGLFPSVWELNTLNGQPQAKFPNQIGETVSLNNNRTGFHPPGSSQDAKPTFMSSNNGLSSLVLPQNPQQNLSGGFLGNAPLVRAASSNPERSGFVYQNRCREAWQGAIQSSSFASSALTMIHPQSHNQMRPNNLVIPSIASPIGNNPFANSSTASLSTPLKGTRGNLLNPEGFIRNTVQQSNLNSRTTFEGDRSNNSNPYFNAMNSLNQNFVLNSGACNKNSGASGSDQLNECTTPVFLANVHPSKLNENYLAVQAKNQDGLVPNNFGIAENMEAMLSKDQIEASLMSGDFGFNNCPLGRC